MPARADSFDLGGLRLSPGEGRRLDLDVALGEFDFSDERYETPSAVPGAARRLAHGRRRLQPAAALRVADLRAVHALPGARLARRPAVDAREIDQPGGGEELTSPYVDGDELDLHAWAHDAYALALPAQVLCRPECLGPVPGVRREPQRGSRPRARGGARPALGQAARAEARMTMTDDVVELTSQLVAIDSVNPSLVAGGAGEAEIAALRRRLGARRTGWRPSVLEETPGRPSVIVRARGTGGGRTLLLCGHLDTVSVEGMADPHAPRVDGDRLYGRGAYDMKAGVAAALIACREAARLGLAGDVVVAAVADEEHASLGVQEALRSVRRRRGDRDRADRARARRRAQGLRLGRDRGRPARAAHGSRPHLGVDAIVKAGPGPDRARRARRGARRAHAPAARPRLACTPRLIEGGVELSSYPARCMHRRSSAARCRARPRRDVEARARALAAAR